jgi:hypothetical protein
MSNPETQPPSMDSGESSVQKQARLRRERRAAKLNAGGSARLEKITNLSGRPPPEPIASSQPRDAVWSPSSTNNVTDPEEIDISSHPYTPRSNNNGPTEADIRQLLRSAPPDEQQQQQKPFAPPQEGPGGEEDPMMRMLQQMLGGAGGAPGQGRGDGGLPPVLAAMMGAQGAGPQGQAQEMSGEGKNRRDIWKIIHAVMASALGVYIVWTTPFSGSQIARAGVAKGEEAVKNFFWLFAMAELLLQSTRWFLEGEKTASAGVMGMVLGMLPEPFRTYASLAVRYSGIFTQLIGDAVTVVFVLGAVAWWRGEVE